MPVKFNDQNANERRRNAEVPYKDVVLYRKHIMNSSTDGTRSAIIIKFPNLIGPKPVVEAKPIVQEKADSYTVQSLANPTATSEVTSQMELSEQDLRTISAQAAVEKALKHELAA